MKKTQKLTTKAAFTLAETLITLAVIGIVAALTIPGLVKNYNEHAWSTAKNVFAKKLDIALKEMNTDGALTGYKTTDAFVKELKKYIKINQICTDDVTRCFAKQVQWREMGDPAILTNDNAIECVTNSGQEWAENVGIRFSNGINAIISYNKNCYVDPYNTQSSPSAACIGIIYDVSGNKNPNANGKDIEANANINKVGGQLGCKMIFKSSNGSPICLTKILAPDTGYSPLSYEDCVNETYEYEHTYGCYEGNDYWAGALIACGGKKEDMIGQNDLYQLALYVYPGYESCIDKGAGYASCELTMDPTRAAALLEQSPQAQGGSNQFYVWSNYEGHDASPYPHYRYFTTGTRFHFYGVNRSNPGLLSICVGG